MTLFLATLRLLSMALFGGLSLEADRGLATRFGDPDDPMDGPYLSCTRKKIIPGQLVCAHRTLPCGSLVLLENIRTGQFAACEVLDRGPFGAILPSGDWGLKLHADEPGDWRGIIDLSPAVSEALGHNGFERVRLFFQHPVRHLRAARAARTAFP